EVQSGLGLLGATGEGDPDNAAFKSDVPFGQVALLDLLQIVGVQFAGGAPRRVSLVLAAFDEISGQTPIEWLRKTAPLVAQYLEANPERPEVHVFGLSAQG